MFSLLQKRIESSRVWPWLANVRPSPMLCSANRLFIRLQSVFLAKSLWGATRKEEQSFRLWLWCFVEPDESERQKSCVFALIDDEVANIIIPFDVRRIVDNLCLLNIDYRNMRNAAEVWTIWFFGDTNCFCFCLRIVTNVQYWLPIIGQVYSANWNWYSRMRRRQKKWH